MNTFNFVLISIYVQNILHAVKGFMLRMIINQVHRDFYFGYSTQLVCVFLKQSSLKPIWFVILDLSKCSVQNVYNVEDFGECFDWALCKHIKLKMPWSQHFDV